MPKKISKIDTTPEMEAEQNAGMARLRAMKCRHFAEGTFVVYNFVRYEVVGSAMGVLTLRDDEGHYVAVRPFALNR